MNNRSQQLISNILKREKAKIKLSLSMCAHCSLCAESCFKFNNEDGNPEYMPSYKMINSIGKLYKKRGDISEKELEKIKDIVWRKCVLCTRCYCPLGIDIPDLISIARSICRAAGVFYDYSSTPDKIGNS